MKFSLNPYHPYRTTAEFKLLRDDEEVISLDIDELEALHKANIDKLQIAISSDNSLNYKVNTKGKLILELCQKKFKLLEKSTAVLLDLAYLKEKVQEHLRLKNRECLPELKSLDELNKEDLERVASAKLNRYMAIYDEIDPLNKALARKTWLQTMLTGIDYKNSYASISDDGVNYILGSYISNLSSDDDKLIEKVYEISGLCVNRQDSERGAKMSENKADLELLLSFINRLDEETKLKLELDSRDSNWQLFFVELNLPKNTEIASEYIFS